MADTEQRWCLWQENPFDNYAAETPSNGDIMRLWRKSDSIPQGKYLVRRRDGTIPEWPNFVIGARDPAAPVALRAYADAAETLGFDPQYVADVRDLACEFEEYRLIHGAGDPDAPPHRRDDPETIRAMAQSLTQ